MQQEMIVSRRERTMRRKETRGQTIIKRSKRRRQSRRKSNRQSTRERKRRRKVPICGALEQILLACLQREDF